jgi:hypothetical protein
MSTSTLRVIQISKQGTHTYVIVSDDKELERSSFEENDAFRKESEDFIKEKYGEYLSVSTCFLDHVGDTYGSAWVKVDPITPGILETIAEKYSLEIEVLP